jgi:hypothetical protein
MALVEARLLRRASRRAHHATVSTLKVNTLLGETVKGWRQYIGQTTGTAVILAIGAYRSPAHIVRVEIEDVRPSRRLHRKALKTHGRHRN